MKNPEIVLGIVGCIIFIFIIAVGMNACSPDTEDYIKTIEAAGHTNVKLTGSPYFGCGEHDYFRKSFSATNPRGNAINGIVCCGAAKACTIRY